MVSVCRKADYAGLRAVVWIMLKWCITNMTTPNPSRSHRKSPKAGRGRTPRLKSIESLRTELDAVRRGMPNWPARMAAAKDLALILLLGRCLQK